MPVPDLASRWRTALRLGRVSNLPTVWTNVLAGLALNGGAPRAAIVLPLGVGLSLFYVAGMYLNDAFDRKWDAQHRPERPIPAGDIQAKTVFVAGFAMMAIGFALLSTALPTRRPLLGAATLAALIVAYDVGHKGNPLAPLLMGLCRVAVYVTAALAVSPALRPAVLAGAALLLAYLICLSLVARQETRTPRLARLVGKLIAGISLLDGAVLLIMGQGIWALAGVAGFVATRAFQRRIAGT